MNPVTALAVARSIQNDHLEAARRRRTHAATTPVRPARPSHLAEMARVLLMGFRREPQPTR
jgi:hypothetical protein